MGENRSYDRSYMDDDIETLGPNASPRHRIKQIDWAVADKIAALGPTKEILADYLGVSPQILDTRCRKDLGMTALEYINQKMAPTKMRLLSCAIEEAIKKRNPTMMIFMLKNLCGFADKKEVKQEVQATQSQVKIFLPGQTPEQLEGPKTIEGEVKNVTQETPVVPKKRHRSPAKKPKELTQVAFREEDAIIEREKLKPEGNTYVQAVFTPEEEAFAIAKMEKLDAKIKAEQEKLAQEKAKEQANEKVETVE